MMIAVSRTLTPACLTDTASSEIVSAILSTSDKLNVPGRSISSSVINASNSGASGKSRCFEADSAICGKVSLIKPLKSVATAGDEVKITFIPAWTITCSNSVVLNREFIGAVIAPIFAAPIIIPIVSIHS